MTAPLPVLFAQHKTAFLAAGAAGVAGLALLQRKKKTTAAGGGTAATPGTIPAAAVIPASGVQGTYPDTSATAGYNQLEAQLERLQASQAVPVPKPVASSLYAPQGTGSYVRTSDGTIAEIESDGSAFGLTAQQWAPLAQQGASWSAQVGAIPYASTATNLAKVSGGTAG